MRRQAASTAASMQRPSELSRRLDPSQLIGHFAAGRSLPIVPPGWNRRDFDGWTLVHEPRLPVQELLDSAGAEIGWLLGHAIDLESGTLVTGSLQTPLRSDVADFGPGLEDWLYALGGRFAAIVLNPKPVIYPDTFGNVPVLFDAHLQCVASSPFLLRFPEETVTDSPLVDELAVYETEGIFTLGATSHARAELLLPNHVLDLTRWEQSRTWPLAPFDSDDVEPLVERVATTLEKTLAAVAATGHPNVGLTAGGDSRSLVACSREFLDQMRFFTVAHPGWLTAMDLATAPTLASRFGLDYRVIPWLEPSKADLELFMYRTGCLVGEFRARTAPRSFNQLGGGEVYVSSVGAEMARGFAWRRSDDPTVRLDPEGLLSRFDFPPHPELLRRTSDWLAALPDGLNGLDVMTLFFAEAIQGPWFGVVTTAFPDAYAFALYPYAHRAIVDAIFRLPWQYRRSARLREDVIAARYRELLDIPFNRQPVRVAVRRRAHRLADLGRTGLSWKAWNRKLLEASRRLKHAPSGR